MQLEKIWFPKDMPEAAPSEDIRRVWCDPEDESNPFHTIVGNEQAVKRLNRSAYTATGRYNRLCNDQFYALLGPPSTGKTTMARKFAELLSLPFVEVSPRSVKTMNDILVQISKVLENFVVNSEDGETTLDLEENDDGEFVLPPMVIFIDEVHALRSNIVQGLLKATEKNDGIMVTEKGYVVDCYNVCWFIATTDRGLLFDAFDTRFAKINLRLYSLDEIAKIIQINNPDWSDSVCQLVARYAGRVPREALAFAREMRLEYEMKDSKDWEKVAATVAEDNGIDPFGMTYQRIQILKSLGQGPIARGRLCDVAQCKEEELVKFVMPALLATTPDQNPLVGVTSRGYVITEDGLKELDKRKITHLGEQALAKKG